MRYPLYVGTIFRVETPRQRAALEAIADTIKADFGPILRSRFPKEYDEPPCPYQCGYVYEVNSSDEKDEIEARIDDGAYALGIRVILPRASNIFFRLKVRDSGELRFMNEKRPLIRVAGDSDDGPLDGPEREVTCRK